MSLSSFLENAEVRGEVVAQCTLHGEGPQFRHCLRGVQGTRVKQILGWVCVGLDVYILLSLKTASVAPEENISEIQCFLLMM